MFEKYDPSSTLENEGFRVMRSPKLLSLITGIFDEKPNLEELAKSFPSTDVFRTKLGDIKQIQNIHKAETIYKGFYNPINQVNKKLAEMLGWYDFEVLNNQLFCKPPNYKMTSAHQDNAYFETDDDVVTFWIPLQDVDIFNSCMFYVPESHKQGLLKHDPIGTNTRVRTGVKGLSLYNNHYKNSSFVKVPMKMGDILVHDKNTMHFSSPNLTDNYRVALTAIIRKCN